MPFASVHTGALTVDNQGMIWVDVAGAVTVMPDSWVSIAGSATLSTLVAQMCLIWEEITLT